MTTARQAHTGTLLNNGMVLIAGGSNNSGALSNAELYNYASVAPMIASLSPASGQWERR